MSNHTPGPWRRATHLPNTIVGADSLAVCKLETWEPNPEVEANAQLITAAPELLEALGSLVDFLEQYPPYFADGKSMYTDMLNYRYAADTAIAKAEGRA